MGEGSIRATLEKQGTPIDAIDTFIAAHALSENLVLVSNNIRFSRIPGLSLTTWADVE